MYHAKEKGRNNYQYYNHEMSARLEQRLELEHELRHALERDEFLLEYQPQVDVEQGRIIGIEALIRWQHPERGRVPPDQFIEIEYEALVKDQEGRSRRLLAHCDLDWDPAVLAFHENASPVATASSVQVRSPIYSTSIGRWKRYGDELEPLKRILLPE